MSDVLTFQHPLDAARLTIGRAKEHIRELEGEVRAYLDTHPYEFVRSSQADDQLVPAHVRAVPPARLSAIIGDCLSNLLASLDLTFWTLALETGPKDPDRERIFFPIFSNELKFQAALPGFARYYVSAEAADVIERIQPFRTRNAALAVLRTLSNKDRHGFLVLTVRGRATSDKHPVAFVAFEDTTLPVGAADAVLAKIARHMSVDVLPRFDSLFA
jgi:hypothetical protein